MAMNGSSPGFGANSDYSFAFTIWADKMNTPFYYSKSSRYHNQFSDQKARLATTAGSLS
jgi:hypothetical protein